jgi:hypothetical protein
LDHLFLDQDGVPTLVETKRSSDTRLRREVVGQMLDYAANAVVYWPVERVRSEFENTCRTAQRDPETALHDFLAEDGRPAPGDEGVGAEVQAAKEFWSRVKTNLDAGKVRLVFVADVIPDELRRVVEFLNGQMDPAEVLAVEVKQFVGQGLRSLVPRVIGQTAEARQKKASGTRALIERDESSFFAEMESKNGPTISGVARRLVQWARSHGCSEWWSDALDGSFVPVYEGQYRHHVFAIRLSGSLEIYFAGAGKKPPFKDEAKRREWWQRLNEVPGVVIPEDAVYGKPKILLSALSSETAMAKFLDVADWYIEQVRPH